jgi:hypothetical protein
MKRNHSNIHWAALLWLAALNVQLTAAPLGTAFTYQGKLSTGPSALTGLYDFNFTLWDASTAGARYCGTNLLNAVPVTNGLFTVTLDFDGVFNGEARWLEIAVRTNGSPAGYYTLPARQPLLPAPQALWAQNADTAGKLSGTIPLGQLPGAVVTNNATGVTLTGTINALGGLVIENRTSDPPSPAVGQIWLRTDL